MAPCWISGSPRSSWRRPGRGFRFMLEGALDMRFDRTSQVEMAEDLVNQL